LAKVVTEAQIDQRNAYVSKNSRIESGVERFGGYSGGKKVSPIVKKGR